MRFNGARERFHLCDGYICCISFHIEKTCSNNCFLNQHYISRQIYSYGLRRTNDNSALFTTQTEVYRRSYINLAKTA